MKSLPESVLNVELPGGASPQVAHRALSAKANLKAHIVILILL